MKRVIESFIQGGLRFLIFKDNEGFYLIEIGSLNMQDQVGHFSLGGCRMSLQDCHSSINLFCRELPNVRMF